MKCNQCGAESPANATFCPQCGVQLSTQGAGAASLGAQHLQGAKSGNQPAEKELWTGSYSPKAMVGSFVGAGLITIVGIVLILLSGRSSAWFPFGIAVLAMWGALLLAALYKRLSVKYSLTTHRLFHESGLLSRTRDRIEVIDIDDVTLSQGFIERMLNIGTIHIISSDESLKQVAIEEAKKKGAAGSIQHIEGRLDLPGIDDVRAVADLIDNTRRTERNRRGVYLENV
jgi:membrane protein YdbS with pleckstrin-like domain